MLPEIDGIGVCKILRRNPETTEVPILMLTAKADEIDRVIGLEVGADDYVTKPFSPRELVLRIKNILRRGGVVSEKQPTFIEIKDLTIDPERYEVVHNGDKVTLTATGLSCFTSG